MKQNSYIGAYYDYKIDAIIIWERGVSGRKLVPYNVPRYFYIPDENGEFTSIFGDKLKYLEFETSAEFKKACQDNPIKFESDIPPIIKVLLDEYHDTPVPIVNYAFIDIEVDYTSKLGFSSPENPYAPINAVTIYQSWMKQFLTFAIPPPNWNDEDFFTKVDELCKEHKLGFTTKITLYKNERELLHSLVNSIQDADIISGWNSEFFDLPYIIKRIKEISPKLVYKMSFTGCPEPKEGLTDHYGTESITYQLYGRTHLDMLDLFKKFTFEGRASYSLANITAEELEVPKLHYNGTLEELYHNDFAHFVCYNFHDVQCLVLLDKKFKFIALVNQMAHENCVLFNDMLGTVKYVETGITNRAHQVHHLKVPDKRVMTDGEKVEGALVLTPRVGLHSWLGSIDIAGLYPSTIQALNISPETFIGQFTNGEKDWEGIRNKDSELHILITDKKEVVTLSGIEWFNALIDNIWVISAYGTVFDSSKLGIFPEIIKFWAGERKRLQAEKKRLVELSKEMKNTLGIKLSTEELKMLS